MKQTAHKVKPKRTTAQEAAAAPVIERDLGENRVKFGITGMSRLGDSGERKTEVFFTLFVIYF
jgi:hypothetical protein